MGKANPWKGRKRRRAAAKVTEDVLAQVDAVIGDRGPFVLLVGEHLHSDADEPSEAFELLVAGVAELLEVVDAGDRNKMVARLQRAVAAALAKAGS